MNGVCRTGSKSQKGIFVGKGARLKGEKAAAAAAALKRKLPERVDSAVLDEAITAVGDLFGTEPLCADAAALMQEVGHYLGYAFTARPVSLVAHQPSTGNIAALGPKATELFNDDVLANAESHLPDGRNTGHMVVTCEDPFLLIDANLRQLMRFGMDAPSLRVNIRSSRPSNGRWSFDLPDLQLLYILDENNQALLVGFQDTVASSSRLAAFMAENLRNGASADDVLRLVRQHENEFFRA